MSETSTGTVTQFPLWLKDEGANPPQRYSVMVDAQAMKDRVLFGIPLKSSLTGQTLSDDSIQQYINEAISEVEHVLDIYITPTQFQEKHDYNKEFFMWSFAYIKLMHPNVLNVQDLSISFNNDFDAPVAISFPREHIHVMPQEGVIQLVPATGTTLGGFVLSVFFGVQFHAMRLANILDYPGSIRVTYTAGFEEGKIPALLVALVETIAAYRILSMLGPLIYPFNSTSIGIDGTSQSVSTPGPFFLKQRMDELEKQREQLYDAAKGYYQRKFLIDYI